MPNPARLDLVHKAILAGFFGNISWKDAALRLVRDDPRMNAFTDLGIRLLLRNFVQGGNCLEVRKQTDQLWLDKDPDNPFWYMAVIPVAEFSNGLFVKVILTDHDEEEPFVEIVSAHEEV